ncbi:MAG: acetate--CoA ligase family protein [Bacteroidales bacterium]|jgi:acetyltransferase|nr:acetate--CoA ligase family protein [Bacteroidales bacterium]
MNDHLDLLFKPRAVALIGASAKELSIGNVIIKNLLHYQFRGPVYPINPKVDEIRGLKAYPSVLDVPGEVDLAHIVIPPPFVPGEVENCGKKGIKTIIINTAGFKEMGAEGQALEDDFLARAKKYGIRIVGPNCQGIINSDPGINAYCNFTFTYPEPGHISVVAQSGGVGAVIMQAFHDMGIGQRMYASNGNGSDVSITEIISYYGKDDETRAIVLYAESLGNPQEFITIAKQVTARKPVLAITAGRTEKGAEASRSHIGGLAGNISMDLIYKKAGILTFSSQEDLCHAAVALSSQPIPKGNKVGIITNTGGPSVIAIDELVNCGLELPPLSEKAASTLKGTMLESASIRNPLDVVATAGPGHFKSAFDVMMKEPQFDSIYLNFVTPPFVDCENVAREIVAAARTNSKPVVCNYMTDKQKWGGTSKILKDGEIPCFDFAETAARALHSMVSYNKIRSAKEGTIKKFTDVKTDVVRSILDNARSRRREVLTAAEVYNLLEAYMIPVAHWKIVSDVNGVVAAANEIGFPVVIKVDSETIIHKSDVGGVALNIKDSKEAIIVAKFMNRKFGEEFQFLVQQFLPKGRELIIGTKAVEGVGHIIMFGLGGIFVEIMKDVVFSIGPVSNTEAMEMIDTVKAAPLIRGFRGEKGINKEKAVEIIQRISMLGTDFPGIRELDLNPLLAIEDEILVVDARIIL